MDWSTLSPWGSLASIVGVVVASVGLAIVGIQAAGAKRASVQTRERIDDVLTFGSGNRASTLIQEMKIVLQKGKWEVGYHQCHTLRALLGDIKRTGLSSEHTKSIDKAMTNLTNIENDLDVAIRKSQDPRGMDSFNAFLSDIQDTLEDILSKAASRQGE